MAIPCPFRPSLSRTLRIEDKNIVTRIETRVKNWTWGTRGYVLYKGMEDESIRIAKSAADSQFPSSSPLK